MNSDENNHKEGPFKQNQAGCITFQASGPGELAEQALWCLLQTNLKNQKDRSQSWVISNTNFVDVLARKQTVEDAVRAVACIPSEAEFALVPIENSVTGTFHQNLELILRYNVAIVGEIEVPLKLHILGMSDESTPSDSSSALNRIKTVAVDPNLYQHCSDFLQASSFEKDFTVSMEACAKKAASSSDGSIATLGTDIIAASHNLKIISPEVQNRENDITRFVLVAKTSVSSYLSPGTLSKTSAVFCLPDEKGLLYRAMACFSLRDIDLTKIESHRSNPEILQSMVKQRSSGSSSSLCPPRLTGTKRPLGEMVDASSMRFEYCFYIDFLGSEFDSKPSSALAHLKEQSSFVRSLGSYPRNGQLVGPVKSALLKMAGQPEDEDSEAIERSPKAMEASTGRLKIGIFGFGNFGQFLAKTFVKYADVFSINRSDKSQVAKQLGVKFYPSFDLLKFLKNDLDVIIMCTSVISFEQMLGSIPKDEIRDCLLVDVLSVKRHPKEVMLSVLPTSTDILCTHPMFGPESGKYSWQGLPFVYEEVRISKPERAHRFLSVWEQERCKMVDMTCELHDEYAANSQFITHLMGRILGQQGLAPTPIDTKGFQNVLNLVETTCSDSFDLFYSLYKYNSNSEETLRKLRESFALVERQIAAKEAYIAARSEIAMDERKQLLLECRSIIREALEKGESSTAEKLLKKVVDDQSITKQM